MPATPRCSARADISSPIRAWSLNPPPSTTITSPGSAVSIALWTSRLSPGAVRSVNAGPQSYAPLCMGRSCGPPAYSRSMLSERWGVTILASSATSFLSGRFGMGRMRKPMAVMSVPLDELHRDSAERPEVPVQGVALVREHDARERAGEYQVTGFERHATFSQPVGEPGDAERRMAEHARGEARLLDLGVAVHDAAGPAQVHFHRADRAAADDDAGRRAVVGNGVENLARVDDTRIDDLHCGYHVLGRVQHVGEPDSRAFQGLAENEGELDLDARDAVVRVRDFRAVGDHHSVEQMPVVGLVDLRGGLHRLGGEPDLVSDEPRARLDPVLRNRGRDGVGILDGDVRIGDRELYRLLFLLLGVQQRLDTLLTLGFGQRHGNRLSFSGMRILHCRGSLEFRSASNHLEKTRRAHAAADAHGDDDVLRAAPLAFDERMAGEARARHTVGVTEGDRAAVDVQPLVRDAEPVAAVDHLHGERLVQFPQTNVFHFQPGAREQSRHGEHRADAHFVRLAAGYREAAENPKRSQVALFGELRVHDDAGGGAVGELARVSGRDGAAFDRRLDLGDALERRVRADAFVVLRRDLLDPTFPRLLVGFLHSHRQGKDLRVESAG